MKRAIVLTAGVLLWVASDMMTVQAQQREKASLHIAAGAGDIEQLKSYVAEGVDLNERDRFGYTALEQAMRGGQFEAAKFLLEAGADANVKNTAGMSPLLTATWTNQVDYVELLLAHGARTDIQDSRGRTPLHLAADRGHVDIARMLVDAGADVNAEGNGRQTPLMIATRRNHSGIAELLREHGAKEPPALNEYEGMYGAYDSDAGESPSSFSERAESASIEIDPNEVAEKVRAVAGLQESLAAVDANSLNEQRSWARRRGDNRTSLLRVVEQQFGEEMQFLKKLATGEEAEKTIAAIDKLTALRKRRYEVIGEELREQRRQQMLEARESRTGRGGYSRGGRRGGRGGRYSRGTHDTSGYDDYERARPPRRAEPNEPPLDPDTEAQINTWVSGDPENKEQMLDDTHALDMAELGALHGVAAEEQAAKSQVAILGLMMLRERRVEQIKREWQEEDERLQRLQERMGTTNLQDDYTTGGRRGSRRRY